MSDAATMAQADAEASEPVIWLLGKTQSGKTSIVAELTGQSRDEVGNGFEPMTKTARVYPFPSDKPILRFLDTRGLADVKDHDTSVDVASARRMAHVVMVVVRVDDQHIDEIVATVRETRAAHPRWPVVVVQSSLHNTYARDSAHVSPYPFVGTNKDFDLPGLSIGLR